RSELFHSAGVATVHVYLRLLGLSLKLHLTRVRAWDVSVGLIPAQTVASPTVPARSVPAVSGTVDKPHPRPSKSSAEADSATETLSKRHGAKRKHGQKSDPCDVKVPSQLIRHDCPPSKPTRFSLLIR